ncbi:MAG: hypothetical protein MR033_04430 [Clostridiales bacterium]|nr:hypothetical protein [Clostridiales bacterium]
MWVGSRRLIRKRLFDPYIEHAFSIYICRYGS